MTGDNYRNGVDIGTGYSTPRPANYVIDIYVATNPLTQTVTFVGSGNCCGTPPVGRAIDGGIAEIILYDRALETTELNEVQSYLADKYGISVTGIPVPQPPETPATVSAISLNFASGKNGDTFDMTPEMVAGVVRTDSWNNLHGTSGSEGNLMANANQSSNGTVEWDSNGTWQTDAAFVDGDTTMMKSHLDARAPTFGPPQRRDDYRHRPACRLRPKRLRRVCLF